MDVAFQGEYLALMESIRMGERLAFERWGKGGRHGGGDIRDMQQLRMGLAALWVGFEL